MISSGAPRSLGEAGELYIRELSFRVVAVAGKRPLGDHGYASATGDLAHLLSSLPGLGVTGIGIQAGPNVLVDIDRAGALEWLSHLIGGKPETLTARSGRGRLHFYWSNPDGLALSYRRDRFPEGLEFKLGNGSGLVAPPSTHPETGRRYEWLAWRPLAPCPAPLLELLTTPATNVIPLPRRTPRLSDHCSAYGLAALRRHADRVAEAGEGSRRNTLNGAGFSCGQLVGSGQLEPDVVAAELEQAALATGLPLAEIRRTVQAAIADGQRYPYYPASA